MSLIHLVNSYALSKENTHYYMDAFVQIAKGEKDRALQIASALNGGENSLEYLPAWKESKPNSIDDFFDTLLVSMVAHDPEMLTELGLLESIGLHDHNAHLTEISIERLQRSLADARHNLNLLQKYEYHTLTESQKLSYDIFSRMLRHAIDGEKFLLHDYKVNQMWGVLINLTSLLTQYHQIGTTKDVENYVQRLYQIPEKLRQTKAFLILQENQGIKAPRFALERVIASIQEILPEVVEDTIFYKYVKTAIERSHIGQPFELLQSVSQALRTAVYPSYTEFKEYLVQQCAAHAGDHGVWALPNGDEYYQYLLNEHTTTTLTPEEIHRLGLQEVESIHLEMRRLFEQEGLNDTRKSIGELMQQLALNQDFYYPDTSEGRQECLNDYAAILERSRKKLGPLFHTKPHVGVRIERVPEHEEDGRAAAYYHQPSMDGSRPGIFFANLRDMNQVPKYGMETLTVHEAEPGHHFQVGLQYEMSMPMARKLGFNTAYIEGWALYAEKLAYEYGFYSSAYSKLGHLQDELLRAARLVIDTGIHYKRWTREQAIEYMKAVTGYEYNSVVTEVERYFVLPGQACAYKIGQLKILALRAHARKCLGERFDIREFHDAILKVGTVPLTILESVVEDYIQRNLR